MKATKEQLYAAIQREREYQKQKWPETGKPLDLYGYMIVAHEELREARLAFCKHVGNEEALRELLQVVTTVTAIYKTGVWVMELNRYENATKTLAEWLENMEHQFALARAEAPLYYLGNIVGMGMRALMEHGVVEREEFSQSKAGG